MNFFRDTQTQHHYIYDTVGAGSLLKLPAKAVGSSITDDTKPAHSFVTIRNVVTYRIDFWNTRAGFKYVANYFVNILNYWHMNEPAPTGAKTNGGIL
jgi:hypothetical protein